MRPKYPPKTKNMIHKSTPTIQTIPTGQSIRVFLQKI